jgi:hypothetical protein
MKGAYGNTRVGLLVSEFSNQSLLVGVCFRGIVIIEASNMEIEVAFLLHRDFG